MAELLRGRRGGPYEHISEHDTIHECMEDVRRILADENYKSYYYQLAYVPQEDVLDIDYGSWGDFFFVIGCDNALDKNEYVILSDIEKR